MSNREEQRARARRRAGAAQRKQDTAAAPEPSADGTRLNRYLSQAGVASRRKADELIGAGQVKVNGAVTTDFSTRIKEGDTVEVGGRLVSPQPFEYILLNKPDDTITTTSDDRDRQTVLDLITIPEEQKEGLFPVGRLDRNTVGVLLLTNDGDLAYRLMHPKYEIEKLYVVRTRDAVRPHQIDDLKKGVMLDDGLARAVDVSYVTPENHHEVALMLHEGRNRQVRRMFEALGHDIRSLERVRYAGLTSEGVRRGRWRRLDKTEVRRLKRIVNLR